MGAALGYALVQPVLAGMLVFTMLALGLAVPYVILTAVPALLRRLPRPGPWLETLKQLLAFPLYATAVWLLWVFGQQVSIDALAVLLLALVLLALGAWSWGRASRSAAGAWWGRAVAVLALVGAVGVASSAGASPRHATVQAGDRADALAWEEFSMARVAELRREGRPVFIDFTAAWCLSCQVNERVALGTDGVRRAFRDANVALLRADWTSRDAEIAAVLAGFGRSGVPLYVLYPSVIDGLPELLPTVLTSGSVIAAVRRAAGQGPAGTID
jgi:thiol:disulfide interchange protein DsbD